MGFSTQIKNEARVNESPSISPFKGEIGLVTLLRCLFGKPTVFKISLFE